MITIKAKTGPLVEISSNALPSKEYLDGNCPRWIKTNSKVLRPSMAKQFLMKQKENKTKSSYAVVIDGKTVTVTKQFSKAIQFSKNLIQFNPEIIQL